MDYELAQLIDASTVLTDRQKEELSKLLERMPLGDKVKLKKIFLKEHELLQEYYRDLGEIKKRSAEKKIKTIYSHTENMVQKVETHELDALEDELNALQA